MKTDLERTMDASIWSFDKKTRENMKRLTSESKKDGTEHGGILCRDFDNTKKVTRITLENECVGTECSIKYPTKTCKNGTKRLGTFHTHPHRDEFDLSYRDIKTFLDDSAFISCVGIAQAEDFRNVLCFTRQTITDLEEMIKEDINISKNLEIQNELLIKKRQINEKLNKIHKDKKEYIDKFLYVAMPEFFQRS